MENIKCRFKDDCVNSLWNVHCKSAQWNTCNYVIRHACIQSFQCEHGDVMWCHTAAENSAHTEAPFTVQIFDSTLCKALSVHEGNIEWDLWIYA